ncbi:17081_t:CDS:2 [Racocetra persica]|uniref:17081_t:CDS:1 n=1 Tax=Racocetra persica TaxID=160502 RepID=A0ACA9MVH2_9GLOM|nr:17081_t:CDS:2 [Racocetra persica]
MADCPYDFCSDCSDCDKMQCGENFDPNAGNCCACFGKKSGDPNLKRKPLTFTQKQRLHFEQIKRQMEDLIEEIKDKEDIDGGTFDGDNREDFEKKIKDDKNADFIKFFKDNLSEFAADSPTGGRAYYDDFSHQTKRTAIREEITSLDLSESGIVNATKKDKASSLYGSTGKNYIGLQGDLDLSDFTKLKELNLSGNYQLGKVNISKCLALEKLFIISNPHQVINQSQQMEMSNLVVANDYPSFQVLVKFGSRSDNAVENKLVKVNSPNFRLVVKSSKNDRLWQLDYISRFITERRDNSGNITRS